MKSAIARGRVGNGLGAVIGGESLDGAMSEETSSGGGLDDWEEKSGILERQSRVLEE